MSLLKDFLKAELAIDFGSEILYGEDQLYISYPVRFATVEFQLISTVGLCHIVDRIRKDSGISPIDYEWYDFYIGLNDWNDTKIDTCIEAIVANSDVPDSGKHYVIDLDENEQRAIYILFDEQCKEYLGKGCAELLAEARTAMEARKQ